MKEGIQLTLRSENRPVLRLLIAAVALLITASNTNGQEIWSWKMLKCPLAVVSRRQVNRRLGKLSRNLQDLASDKQDLAETLSDGNNAEILARITELEQTVQRLRQNLDNITSILHPSDRQSASRIADQLFRDLMQKNSILEEARRKVNGGQPNMSAVRGELEFGVRFVLDVKSKIDALITDLENKPCPP